MARFRRGSVEQRSGSVLCSGRAAVILLILQWFWCKVTVALHLGNIVLVLWLVRGWCVDGGPDWDGVAGYMAGFVWLVMWLVIWLVICGWCV